MLIKIFLLIISLGTGGFGTISEHAVMSPEGGC